nr:hypothetical protein [Halomonas chromatireducens]
MLAAGDHTVDGQIAFRISLPVVAHAVVVQASDVLSLQASNCLVIPAAMYHSKPRLIDEERLQAQPRKVLHQAGKSCAYIDKPFHQSHPVMMEPRGRHKRLRVILLKEGIIDPVELMVAYDHTGAAILYHRSH